MSSEESLYVGQVDEDAAGRVVHVHHGTSATDAATAYVVYRFFVTVVVEERKAVQIGHATTTVRPVVVEHAAGIFFEDEVRPDGLPVDDFCASCEGSVEEKEKEKEKASKKKGHSLYGSGDGKGERGQLGVVAFQVPSVRLHRFVPWYGDAGVLTVARGDDDRRPVLQEAIDLPLVGSVFDPLVVTFDEEFVETSELLEIEPNEGFRPAEKEKMGLGRWQGRTRKTHMTFVTFSNLGADESRFCA